MSTTEYREGQLREELALTKQKLEAAQLHIKELLEALESVSDLIDDSYGVVGLHLNGDVAPWQDLRTGGKYESWLVKFDSALSKQPDTRALDKALLEAEIKALLETDNGYPIVFHNDDGKSLCEAINTREAKLAELNKG